MGVDDTEFTAGYLQIGDILTFKVYDASDNRYYLATPLENIPYGGNLSYQVIDSISVVNDCAGELGGIAFLDDCGSCAGGTSGHIPNSDQDCQGECFGDAYVNLSLIHI